MKKQNVRNIYVDLFRLLLVILVINIHFNQQSIFMPVFRMAVPMFFMLSGYFSYSAEKERQENKNVKLIKKSLLYLVVGYILCFIVGIIIFIITKDISKYGLVPYSYHLWFLLSLFLVGVIHYFVCKRQVDKIYFWLAPVLIIIALFLNGYIKLLWKIELPIAVTRNSIFTGLPMFSIGYLLRKYVIIESKKCKIIIFLSALCLLFLSILESKIVVMEYYLCSVLSAIGFVVSLTAIKGIDNEFSNWFYKYVGANSAFNIYIIHTIVGSILALIGLTDWLVVFLTFVISFILSEIYHLIMLLLENKKHKKVS